MYNTSTRVRDRHSYKPVLGTVKKAINPNLSEKVYLQGTYWQLRVVSSADINGANAAFDYTTDTIYLSREFLAKNSHNLQAKLSVLLEEIRLPDVSKRHRYRFTASEIEEFGSDCQEPLPKVVRSAIGIKRHRYQFTASEIEEFEPGLKL
ncbi:MAG: hypothetical protein JGK30_20485 [Microcoleus sp. PH2017_40_RAT_O_B]|uniref:hypothetical protein n=1 Tax=unclassified Microcoleus TaxID=2642155 RepID=UPI001D912E52|nr:MULTISPECIES: hypothetical protein [unclassified Microcoleus]MCC3574255.1 hypothetical protein [Microcoleus sp. PH2017_34_RAT_O_A]MCC3611787.1 hypothetical protein [Microcoleus sp. PH2017_40_RAT_O_B]